MYSKLESHMIYTYYIIQQINFIIIEYDKIK